MRQRQQQQQQQQQQQKQQNCHHPRRGLGRSMILFLFAVCIMLSVAFDSVAAAAAAVVETMTIEGHLQYSNKIPYNISAQIVVNYGEYITYSRVSDGNFTIHDITPGVYIIDIISPIHHFSQVKCLYKPHTSTNNNYNNNISNAVSSDDTTATKKKPVFSCIEYYYPGATKHTIDQSNLLVLNVLASYDYFETKRGFSILSILKNPMILMMIMTGGIMYMLPKMMDNMDPEERAMMQKQIQMQQDTTKMMTNLFSGGSTTTNDDLGNTSPIRPTITTSTTASPEGKQSSSSNNHKQSKRNRK